ncbi:xanthine dehydrogenase family protein molybdopterin-binding subunit [Amycolatopsis acidiphila]|uniref:Xanthine dehydrogenase family protein molybdopterin-binding subunit n=1 Tax=Amycolatopsis acidiphila TaxID=715473 RepID=A0A558ANX6_9PSEU|nr:xanthine dehydrogenase family protein molybdopterin-binding subunit [Amycolatopsis acidiphila]TVT25967.1 xanthine dehydrogenase family protein molybdopterin-binding subunit [Amycolatopsis acidiphila]UIJ63321.1 xanthine dehydrogenase family protein molybdopterin-binding subunit [Amycolatopsis acidiphila]GHG75018.1 aldehyde dehydrogenase [Amycolatopsis acidiphila]
MTTLESSPERTAGRRPGALGVSVARKEDERLLRGDGQFTDDVDPARVLYMAVARCPYPHARIVRVDTSAAERLEGVQHVLSGPEVQRLSEPLGVLRPVPGAPRLPYYALAQDVATHEGQPVVSIVATSRHLAEDALELVDVEYQPLPHVVDVLAALEPDAPVLHPSVLGSNLLASNSDGRGDPAARFAEADVVVEGRFRIGRVTALPMETRGVVAQWRPGARELTVHCSTQVPHLIRKQLAESLRLRESEVRAIASDVGGGFGLKLGVFPEDVLACLHAMALHRPVKWSEDRGEHFRASTHGRESVHDYRIAADADGRILAMTDVYATDIGGWNSPFGSAQLSSVVFNGPYKVEDGYTERRVTLTNKTPVGAYRGYGQPEVNFAYERLMDRLARRLRMDPVELRARNMLKPADLPWVNPAGAVYDSGDYERCLRMAAERIGWAEHRAAPRRPRADGRLVGIGFSSFVERTGYASSRFLAKRGSQFGAHESITLRANRSGGIDAYTGVSTIGQSSETAFAQLVAEVFGTDYDAVTVHVGDTAASPLNTGSFASRTMIAAAGAIREASEQLARKTLRLAAFRLEVQPEELEIAGPLVRHRTEPGVAVPLAEVYSAAITGQGIPPGEDPGLEATSHFEPSDAAYSFGTAAALVAVDPETGEFGVERFVLVHDAGTVVNPKIVDGQVRGALAQGFGAALTEELRYDAETGQLVNGSMVDYFPPTAADLPPVELLHTEVPSPVTPFGIRGVGEVGTIPPGAAIANAICEALADHGVELDSLPVTPEKVWRALTSDKGVEQW